MFKWIFTLVLAIFILGLVTPHVARFIRYRRLPGDFHFRFRGRDYVFPVTSTLIASLLLTLLTRLL